MILKFKSLFIILLFALNSVAQTGPGGIEDVSGGSDLSLWLDANKISLANGSNLSSWVDQSGYTNTASALSGNEPVFHTNVLNSRPVVRFTATNLDYLRVSDVASLKPNTISIFVVGSYTTNSGNGDGWGVFIIKTDDSHWQNGYGLGRWDKDAKQVCFVNSYNSNYVSANLNYNTSTIMSGIYDKTNIELFYNESSQGTDSYTDNISNSNNYLYVGTGPNIDGTGIKHNLDGDIAEVIIIKRNVNVAERIIINNYLSAKYGISISHDYYSYQANYSYDLAGIGRVDASNTHTASMSAGILQIENPSSMTSNDEFLFYAHDNGSISAWTATEAPSVGNIERVVREWRLDETGSVGTIDIKISNTNLPALNSGYTKYGVMIDSDGDFTNGAKVYELSLSGSYYVASGISFNDGDYVSIAAIKPIIEFRENSSSAFESNSVNAEVFLNYTTSIGVSVDYSTSDGSATSASDYTSTSGTFNIAIGNNSNTISVTVTDDALIENDEDLDITISNPSSGLNLGSNTIHNHIIHDNDNPRKLNFNASSSNGSESNTSVNIDITISNADASNDTKVDYKIIGGTASGGGTDYTLADGTLTIPAGSGTNGAITVSINNDAMLEDDETIIIELTNPINCNLGTTTTHTYTINDDDVPPNIQFHSTASSGSESVNTKNLQIEISSVSSSDVSVTVTASGTAIENTDYTKSNSTITIIAGNTSADLTLTVTDDNIDEVDETAIFTLSAPVNANLGTNTSHTYTIIDNDNYDGPANVDYGVKLWVKADAGITSSGGNISAWNDQTGLGNNATQSTSSYQPSFSNSELNYQASIYFDGGNEFFSISDLIPTDNTKMTVIAVGSNEAGGDTWHSMVMGQAIGSWNGGGYGLSAQNKENTDFGFWVNDYNEYIVKTAWLNQPEKILIGNYDGSNLSFYMDAKSIGSDSYSGTVGDNGNSYIGGCEGTKYNHKGYISEVAIYSRSLNSTELKSVNSYLAVKYGITLDRSSMTSNYYNSNSASIFNDGGTYWNDIIGVGRDDDATLYQKQSKQADDSTRIYLASLTTDNSSNTGSFSSDNQFLIMGSNMEQLCATAHSNAEVPPGIVSRLERNWKIKNSGFGGTFSVDITLNSKADVDNVDIADLRLIVDDDGDFSDASVYDAGGGLSFSYAKPVVTISGISTTQITTNSVKYFTLASIDDVNTPLPIELLSFSAVKRSGSVVLEWKTASETNNDFFTIERSDDLRFFSPIVMLDGAGNSLQQINYEYEDLSPLDGSNYYRLKQTDFDGVFSYSKIVNVNYSETGIDMMFFPNPTKTYLQMNIESIETKYLKLTNAMGQELNIASKLRQESNSTVFLDMSELPNGVYIIIYKTQYAKVIKE